MGTVIFRGDAQAVAQVNTITVGGTAANGQVYTVTINGKTVTYTATGSDTNATIASSLQSNLESSTIPEFQEVTWTVDSLVITGTATTAGMPFTNTSGATGTGTLVTATTTNSAGPNHWDTATNWSGGAVPTAADDVYIENSSVNILYGLDQNTVALTSLNIAASYTGQIGNHNIAEGDYYEYREKSLKIRPGTLNIGYGDGSGSSWLRINTGTVAACTGNIWHLGTPAESGVPALVLEGGHANNVLNMYQGRVGLAYMANQTANWPVVRVGSLDNPATDAWLFAGTGCSAITTLDQNGGEVTACCNVTTWTKTAGTGRNLYSATIGTLVSDGPHMFHWDSNGTITTGTFRDGSVLNNTRDNRTKTLTNSTFTGGGYFIDPMEKITFSNAFLTDAKSSPLCVMGVGQFSLQRS